MPGLTKKALAYETRFWNNKKSPPPTPLNKESQVNTHIPFPVAHKAYTLICKGVSPNTAVIIATARMGKQELKKLRKDNAAMKKNHKTLTEALSGLEKAAQEATRHKVRELLSKGPEGLTERQKLLVIELLFINNESVSAKDAFAHTINTPLEEQSALDKDLLESNQDSIGMWS